MQVFVALQYHPDESVFLLAHNGDASGVSAKLILFFYEEHVDQRQNTSSLLVALCIFCALKDQLDSQSSKENMLFHVQIASFGCANQF